MTHAIEVVHMGSSPGFPDDVDAVPDRGSPPRMPRWVKWSAIVVAALILMLVVVMSLSGMQHGPGRHLGGDTAPAGVVSGAYAPAGGQG
jgi:hypothetical protein